MTIRRALAITAIAALLAASWLIPHLAAKDSHQNTSTPRPSATGTTPPDVITWDDVAGITLPVSPRSGPHCVTTTTATCFTHDQTGAAFAAVHIMIRSFPFTGPKIFGPTIGGQVTGLDAARMARLTLQTYQDDAAATADGAPIQISGMTVAGYHPASPPTGDAQTVDVLIHQDPTSPDVTSEYFQFTVRLLWQAGDWKIVAPSWGDWTTAAQPVADPDPASWHPYESTLTTAELPTKSTLEVTSCLPCA